MTSIHRPFEIDIEGEIPKVITEVNSNYKNSVNIHANLSLFQCIVDTLNSSLDDLVHSEYFLYDFIKDVIPELWIISGRCEADKELWIYQKENHKVQKIYFGNGGHTDFFLNGDIIGRVTCNTGSGYVSIYHYDEGRIKVRSGFFSTWNDEGHAKAFKKVEQPIIEIWERSDFDIPLKPLK